MTTPPNMDPALREEVFVSRVGEVPTVPASGLDSFFLEVHRCCIRWLDAHTDKPAGACVFALSERIDLDPVYEKYAAEFVLCGRLDSAQPPEKLGPIVLTSGNLRLAFSRSHSAGCHVSDLAQALKDLGLADRPAAIFVPVERTLTFYPRGIDNKPTLAANAGALRDLDPADMDSLLQYFHENWTRYPDGFCPCWDNPGDRIVERNAERNVRNALFVFLSMVVYRSQYVTREHQLPNGRADIFIYGVVLGTATSHRVVELKVLRSRSIGWKANQGRTRSYSEAGNKRYVEQGLRQAKRYQTATIADKAFLCCFDARLQNTDIDVHNYAQLLNVSYSRYFMESSTRES